MGGNACTAALQYVEQKPAKPLTTKRQNTVPLNQTPCTSRGDWCSPDTIKEKNKPKPHHCTLNYTLLLVYIQIIFFSYNEVAFSNSSSSSIKIIIIMLIITIAQRSRGAVASLRLTGRRTGGGRQGRSFVPPMTGMGRGAPALRRPLGYYVKIQ